jgi:hypothetical protein
MWGKRRNHPLIGGDMIIYAACSGPSQASDDVPNEQRAMVKVVLCLTI